MLLCAYPLLFMHPASGVRYNTALYRPRRCVHFSRILTFCMLLTGCTGAFLFRTFDHFDSRPNCILIFDRGFDITSCDFANLTLLHFIQRSGIFLLYI